MRFAPSPTPPAAFERDVTTFACYFLLALLTLFLAMLGPLMPPLMGALDLGYAAASLHSVALAIGIALMGAIGERFARRLGRDGCIRLSFAIMSLGLTLLCLAGMVAMSLIGAFLIGAGGGLVLMCAPAAMAERHGGNVGRAFGEANVIAYIGIVSAPAVVALMLVAGAWRLTFVLPALACALFLLVFARARLGAAAAGGEAAAKTRLSAPYWWFWLLLMACVSAENIILVWSPSYYQKQLGLEPTSALWASMSFPAGIVAARIAGLWLVRHFPAQSLTVPALGVALAGYAIFAVVGGLAGGLAGMFVMGLGIGNIYPFGITLALATADGSRDTATARASLASALSMVSAPFIAGAIADRTDMFTAFGLIPAYLCLGVLATFAGLRLMQRA